MPQIDSADVLRAFHLYEAQTRVTNTKVGCFLVVTLMPAGSFLDFFVYPREFWPFFGLRLVCSAIAALIWAFLYTPFGKKNAKALGFLVPLLPVVFIAGMITAKEGFASPYYAGLNLVLLAVGSVLHWSLQESIAAVILVIFIYIGAGTTYGQIPPTRILVNNFYFISLMDIIVVVGTYFQNRQRFREFALRFELDRNKKLLEESNLKLVELDQVKNRFFANISHELRTPLTLLLAPLEALMNRSDLAFTPETRSLLQTMHSNGIRLLKLINDLLDLVRLESGRMEVKQEPLEMKEFVRSIVAAGQQVAADKKLRLESYVEQNLGAMLGDRDKLEKIVLNLMFNALKFTPSGGSVAIRVERKDDDAVISVKDTGIGIAQKNLPFVFDRFWQADGSSKRKYQGVGIGLSLVKELVEIQCGTVSVESEEGTGTTFTVRLPFNEVTGVADPHPEERSSPEQPGALAPTGSEGQSEEWLTNLYRRAALFPSVNVESQAPVVSDLPALPVEEEARNGRHSLLIADDEVAMLSFLRSQLKSHYHVLEACDGQEAIDRATAHLPDIILLDMNMPEKDGLQVCRELRQLDSTKNTPIILLTARADEETKLAALSAGASDFLTKPFSVSELHVRIKNLVESHDYQQTLTKQKEVLEITIEQLKETESQLVQTEKLASLGRLSAGIIHEINNPLNFATTGLFTLRKKGKHLPEEQRSEFSETLNDVEEGLTRVKNIVSDLRSFTHPSADVSDRVLVADVVGSALKFLSNEWKEKVQIDVQIPPQQAVTANRNRMVQVFINLLQNSLEAIRRRSDLGEPPRIVIRGQVADGKSAVTIRDNGEGIETKNIDKIFDPFFTTRDVGEGMGLGLSICYRIVHEAGGQIRVQSERGKFCEFTLEFPENAQQSATAGV